jgi:uncharacterized protein
MIVISDTSPITNLMQVNGGLDILEKIFGKIIIAQTVYNELCQITSQKNIIDKQTWVDVLSAENTRLLAVLEEKLDKGEAESIVLAIELNADYLVIDEAKGRAIAESMGIKIVGLLGTLVKAKEKGIVSEVKPIIDDLKKIGFRIHPTLYKHILKITNE